MPGAPYPPVGGPQDVFFPRASVASLPEIVAGDGVHLVDDGGRRLIDVCSGPFLAGLGQGNERVLAAMLQQGRRLTYTYSRSTRHAANSGLTRRIAGLAGPGFERVLLTSGGSEAVEMAIKFLRARAVARGEPERQRVITLMPGYHGATLYDLGLNGDHAAAALWGPMTVPSEKIPAPLTFRAPSPASAAAESLIALETTVDRLGPERVLALVMEPIGGQASGVNVPDPSFARGARSLCNRFGIGLVFDEVVSALRTGHFLAAQHDPEALPDIAVLAKGLAAGYAPLGAALVPARYVDELAATTGFVVSHSYDASPIACAAGSAVLDEVVDRDLLARARVVGERIRAGLDEMAAGMPLIGDVRGRGLLSAVELVSDEETLAPFPAAVDPGPIVLRHGVDHGLLLYSRRQNGGRYGDWLLVAPPLVIDDKTADELVERFAATLAAAAADLRRACV